MQLPYSIATDSSNHKETKTFPIVVRYFSPSGIKVKLLEFSNLPGESSEIISNFLKSTIDRFGLNTDKLVAFCADNASVNFGGVNQISGKNVFSRLKDSFNPSIIPIGCPAHICHNAAKKAGETLTIDAEAIVSKIASYFNGSTSRHEQLKEFCEFVDTMYLGLPTHTRTRWLSLLPVIERVLKLWSALRSYFLSVDNCPRILEEFFANERSELYFLFLQSVLTVFQSAILTLEKDTLCLPQMIKTMIDLRQKLADRQEAEFYGATTTSKLKGMDDTLISSCFKKDAAKFFSTAIDYINKWFRFDSYPNNLQWLLLENRDDVSYEIIRASAEFLKHELSLNDCLFDEVTLLRSFLQNNLQHLNNLTVDQRWVTVFKDNGFPVLKELVATLLSIPASNAPVERVFLLSKIQWTDDRNRLKVETICSLLLILMNCNETCSEMYAKLLNNRAVFKQILSKSKFNF